MPIARPEVISSVCGWFRTHEAKRVLDVGLGFGLWGFLARQYLFLWTGRGDLTVEKYRNWRNGITVDGIEIYRDCITDLQRLLYNNIYIGDMRDLLPKIDPYDLIIFGDVLEHVSLKDGLRLLQTAREKAKWVIITTPDYFVRGRAIMGNEWEKHRHHWKDEDFPSSRQVIHVGRQKVIIYEAVSGPSQR